MNIAWDASDLTQGVLLENGLLHLPASGGGLRIRDFARHTERYLNLTLTVEESHSMAFELRVYGQGDVSPRVTVRFGVMPHYRTNVPTDLNWLDGHVLFPGHVVGE